jgi:hypothetical protein
VHSTVRLSLCSIGRQISLTSLPGCLDNHMRAACHALHRIEKPATSIALSNQQLQPHLRVQPQSSSATPPLTSAMSRSGRAAGASRRPADEPDNGASSLSKSLYSLSFQRSPRPRSLADESPEICPVCRSTSYLNPDLKFQINPGCYHRLCDNCVIRYFGDMKGNGICPVPGCAKTLSRTKFRRATFEDLKVEREMDLRKDVMKM